MHYRKLGKSAVEVSEISLGCWTMGGLNWVNGHANGWANVDEAEITEAVKSGIDAGINHFDNADVYGNGEAERMLARVFARLGIKSEDFVIASKVGHFPGTAKHAYEPAHIRHQCEQSLLNLKRDYLDIYYFHHGDFGPEDCYLDDAVETMNQLVVEGKVRLKGQSAYSSTDFERIVPKVEPTVLQSWANALDTRFIKKGSIVAQLLEKRELSFVAFSPLAQGRLLGKYSSKNPPQFERGDHRGADKRFSAEGLAELEPKIEQLKARFGSMTEDLSAIALRYLLNFSRVGCVIPGFRNARQVACNLSAVGRELDAEDMAFIRDVLGGSGHA